jgi:hypothetical protein
VLASGAITLVDVPGFGDANKTRFFLALRKYICADSTIFTELDVLRNTSKMSRW